ncbi:MAG: RAD55 family ATPase [Candidatus Helarchaeota archaeon]
MDSMTSPFLPLELIKFLNLPFGFSLLVKGMAGTGKTSLALTILKESLKGNHLPVYISTRIMPNLIKLQYPWIKDYLDKIQFIDASNVDLMMPSQNTMKSIKNKLRFQNTPEFFIKIFEFTENIENCTIVIDSWDAVTETIKYSNPSDHNQIEPILTELVRQHNFKMILVLENFQDTFMDYLVDGVIILNNKRYQNRRVRTIEIQKIRGVKNAQPEYIYSLNNAQFKYFPPFKFVFPEILIKPKPIYDPDKNIVSTGMPDFDTLADGGLQKGSWNLLEIAHGIGEGFFSIIIPLIVNHINLERGLVAILPDGISPIIFNQYLEGFIGKERLQKLVSAINIGLENNIQNNNNNRCNIEEVFGLINEKISYFNERFGWPVLTFLGLSSLQHIYDEKKLISSIAKQIALCRAGNNITIVQTQEKQNIINSLSHMVSTHWKLDVIDKALVLYGIQPETEMNAVISNASEGYINTNLIPIV